MFYKGKHSETKQRFTIKKFKIGAASVLIGTLFVGFTGQVKAEEVAPVNPTTEAELVTPTDAPEEASTEVGDSVSPEVAVQPVIADPVKEEAPATNVEEAVEKTELSLDKETVTPSTQPEGRRFIPTNTLPKDPTNNATERTGEGKPLAVGSGFRANVEATEGPTNANKVGYGNNPENGIFAHGLTAENEDMSTATLKSHRVTNQLNAAGPNGTNLGTITYNWKEKEVTETADGWKATDPNSPFKVIEVLNPTEYNEQLRKETAIASGKDENFYIRKGKAYVESKPNTVGNGYGGNASQVITAREGSKYIELVNQGSSIYREFDVNPNSMVAMSVSHTGAYGDIREPKHGEEIIMKVVDAADPNRIIQTIVDKNNGGNESSVSGIPGKGTNLQGWHNADTGRIYKIPAGVSRIRVILEAGRPGSTGTGRDGYLVDDFRMATLPGLETTTNVISNGQRNEFGPDNVYKKNQAGRFEVSLTNVGAMDMYQASGVVMNIKVPEGVELTNKKSKGEWVWYGNIPAQTYYDESTRNLRLVMLPWYTNSRTFITSQGKITATLQIPFVASPDFKGDSTFELKTSFTTAEGYDGRDLKDENKHVINRATYNDRYMNRFFGDTEASNDPNYVYKKTIYIDTITPAAPTVSPIHTDAISGEDKATGQAKTITVTPPILDEASNDLASMDVTFPGNKKVTLTQKTDGTADENGWYNGNTKVGELNSPLTITVPDGVNLNVGNDVITATVTDKAGNISDRGLGDVVNIAPEVLVGKSYTLRAPSTTAVTDEQLLAIGKVTATDLEDDRDGADTTTPTKVIVNRGNFDPNVPGTYTITVKSVDSERKESTPKTFEIEVVDPNILRETVTRTINYKYEDGNPIPEHPPVVQTVTYTREVNADGTGLTEWVSDKKTFDRQNSPEVTGYTPDDAFVPKSAEVTPTAEDITVDVTYNKDGQRVSVSFINKTTKALIAVINDQGKSGEDFTKSAEVDAKLEELKNKGYVLEIPADNEYPVGEARKFDKDKATDQNYTIKLVEKKVEITTPVSPNTPKDPSNPTGPKWTPEEANEVNRQLSKDVTRTVTYVKEENGAETPNFKPTVTDKITFTRKLEVNVVTGEVTPKEWESPAKTSFDKISTPVETDYLADIKEVAEVTGVTAETANAETKVTYRPIGKYVPVVPEGETPIPAIPYPNHPTDPTKPGEPTEVIPYVEGLTPQGPDGVALTPKNPTNPKEGYNPPALPEDGKQDTPITYVKDNQVATITFEDNKGEAIPNADAITEEGGSGTTISTTKLNEKLDELKKAGYIVKSNPLSTPQTFDKNTVADQTFKVVLEAPIVNVPVGPKDPSKPVGPENPVVPVKPDGTPITPDTPINPENPDGPKWTKEDLDNVTAKLTETVTRTINYVKNDNTEAAPTVTETLTFRRPFTINGVTKEIQYKDWVAPDKLSFDKIESPVVSGYVANKAEVEATNNIQPTTEDITETVTYNPIGKYVPTVPDGYAIPTLPSYQNNPDNPTKVLPPTEVIPYVEGLTPEGPNGEQLEFVDSDNPNKGYVPPALPTDGTEDTRVNYKKDDQLAIVKFINKSTNTILDVITERGKSGAPFAKVADVEAKLAELAKAGYEVGSEVGDNTYPAGDARKFDTDKKVDQEYVIKLVEKVVDLPSTPPVPGKPVNPDDPNSPVWPPTVENIVTTKDVTRTVTYVKNENNTESPAGIPNATDKVTFERTAKINLATGAITYGEWTAKDGDTTFDAIKTNVLEGYVADKASVPAIENVTATTDNVIEKVTYKPIGKYVPKVPEGYKEPTLPPYTNNPEDPTGVLPPETVIPHVPGTTPVGPQGPLTPKDPTDPTKGYVPPTPIGGDTDTPITYVEKGDQVAVISYVVETYSDTGEKSEKVLVSETVVGKTGKDITFDTAATLAELEKRGYELVSNGYATATDEAKKFDDDTTVTQNFKVTVQPRLVEVDPKDPKTPGTPIDPNNPDGPKWPDGVQESALKRTIKREVSYVKNENGQEVPLETKTDEVNFTRKALVNVVTGQITYGTWKPVNDDTTFDEIKTPVVEGYLADKASVPTVSDLTVDSYVDTKHALREKVTYKPIGSFVPKVPEGETPIPPIPYPNDPKDPTKPGTPTTPIPHIPGTTPQGPDGQPLTPVDPKDPSKGYNPPAIDPNNPGKDIDIVYIPKTIVPGKELHPEVPERSGDSNEGDTPNNAKDSHSGNPSEVSSEQAQMGSDSTTAKMTELPETGDAGSIATTAFGLGTLLASLGLVSPRRKKK